MANQEYYNILKQGVEIWNQWRKEHANIQSDLNGFYLSRANLSRANLNGADLSGATLIETNFAEATLTNCQIYGISALHPFKHASLHLLNRRHRN